MARSAGVRGSTRTGADVSGLVFIRFGFKDKTLKSTCVRSCSHTKRPMTLPSSVQRYYNSCVIPKSYEQKKDVTVQSRPLIVFFYLCLIYNSSLFFTYIHIGESRISFLTFSLLSRFLPFAYTISRRIARSKTRCQRTKSQAINFVCYTCSRLICFRFIHILKFIYFHTLVSTINYFIVLQFINILIVTSIN